MKLASRSRLYSLLTESTRKLLARFFKVLPGYLVSDPAGWEPTPSLPGLAQPDRVKAWLLAQAEQTGHEPLLAHLLLRLARHPDPRRYLWLFDRLVDLPIEEAERRVGGRVDGAQAPVAADIPAGAGGEGGERR